MLEKRPGGERPGPGTGVRAQVSQGQGGEPTAAPPTQAGPKERGPQRRGGPDHGPQCLRMPLHTPAPGENQREGNRADVCKVSKSVYI